VVHRTTVFTKDPFCNAEARAVRSLRDRSRIVLTRGGSRASRSFGGARLPETSSSCLAADRTESVGRWRQIHGWSCCRPVQVCTVLSSGSGRAHSVSAYPIRFGVLLFGDLLDALVFVVGELSYQAARVTSREDSVGNVACDHAARTDDRP
jgi:hypothetical protein